MTINRRGAQLIRWTLILVCALVGILVFTKSDSITHAQARHVPVHMTSDWSNRHVVYSAPKSNEKIKSLQADPRYRQQLVERRAPSVGVAP